MTFVINNRKNRLSIDELIREMEINGKKVVKKINYDVKCKNNNYHKHFFCIMTESMIKNIKDKENNEYFIDVTYYVSPTNCKIYKIFVIISFDKEKNTSKLCNISLIMDEKYITFKIIFEYLKSIYDFNPKIIVIDFCVALYKSITVSFNNVIVLLCFYHYSKNIYKKIPNIKSKDKRNMIKVLNYI